MTKINIFAEKFSKNHYSAHQ